MMNKKRRLVMGQIVGAVAAVVVSPLVIACDDKDKAKEHLVEIEGSQFDPVSLKVQPGDTITWVNRDIVPHTATAKDESWDTELIATNERKSIVVTADMNPDYYCRFHPVMVAKLEVG